MASESLEARSNQKGYMAQSDDDNDGENESNNTCLSSIVRQFLAPKLNFNAEIYFQLVPSDQLKYEPPAIENLTDQQLNKITDYYRGSLNFALIKSQGHIQLVFDASLFVVDYQKRDGLT